MIRRLGPWAIAIASIAVFAVAPILDPTTDPTAWLVFGAATASFVLVGLLLVARARGNRVGPWFLLAGTVMAVAYGLGTYATVGAAADPAWPGAGLAAPIGDALYLYPIVIALIIIPLIFPDGHLISRSWRPVLWLVAVAAAAQTFATLVSPDSAPEGLTNPLAVPELQPLASLLAAFASAASIFGFAAAAAALWLRYRRGGPIERQQLKWLVAVAALAAILFPLAFIVPNQDIANVSFILGALTLVALPLAIALAILRYRLFEIDRIVSRTIAYVLITAVLVGAYAGLVIVIGGPLAGAAGGQTITVALSTLVVAALFQPLRRRVQAIVDQRFDRARIDAERTTAAFSERLRDEVDIETVTTDLRDTVRAAVRPVHLGVWLREAGR